MRRQYIGFCSFHHPWPTTRCPVRAGNKPITESNTYAHSIQWNCPRPGRSGSRSFFLDSGFCWAILMSSWISSISLVFLLVLRSFLPSCILKQRGNRRRSVSVHTKQECGGANGNRNTKGGYSCWEQPHAVKK